jgi:transposase
VIGLPTLTSLDRAASTRIWLAVAPADMRCGFDRLAELAGAVTDQNPMEGGEGGACTHLFLFRGRGGDRLKILYWDRDGYALWYKRLEEGVFKLPRFDEKAKSVELRASELAMLLDGIDLRSIRRVKRFSRGFDKLTAGKKVPA